MEIWKNTTTQREMEICLEMIVRQDCVTRRIVVAVAGIIVRSDDGENKNAWRACFLCVEESGKEREVF